MATEVGKDLERVFSNFEDSDKIATYMLPPCIKYRCVSPIGKASGAMALTEAEEGHMRGDKAENTIFQAIEKFGVQRHQPMVVFSNFEILKFIKNISDEQKALFAEQSGEIDFIIIHRCIGVIIIEVKSGGKKSRNARKQLESGEKFIKVFIPQNNAIPVFKVIALPNAPNTPSVHEGYINLRNEDLKNFENWWSRHFKTKDFSKEEKENIVDLAKSLCQGIATEAATIKVLDNVFKDIDKQAFLEGSFKKNVVGVERPKSLTLEEKLSFLNPEQLSIWNGKHQQIFCGASGSGKTILLQHKALECLKNGQKVIIFVPKPLNFFYEDFLKENQPFPSENCCIVYKQERIEELHSLDSKLKPEECNIFVDEFQKLCTELHNLASRVVEFIGRKQNDCLYRWISYDLHQIVRKSSLRTREGMDRSYKPFTTNGCLFSTITVLIEKHSFTHAQSLTTVVRNTPTIYEFLQKQISNHFSEDTSLDGIKPLSLPLHDLKCIGLDALCSATQNSKHLKMKPEYYKAYWYHEFYSGHQVSGPAVIEHTCKEVEDAVKLISDELDKWVIGKDYSKVAVLVSQKKLLDMLASKLISKKITVSGIGRKNNALVVDLAENSHSFEWLVVISVYTYSRSPDIDFFYRNYVSFSRAVVRLVCINIE